jgi:polysaccharide export outer membrane protein
MFNKRISLIFFNIPLLCFGMLIFLFSSCVTQHKLEYLQPQRSLSQEYPNSGFQDYKLKPNDELYIQITSLDDAAATISSSSSPTSSMLMSGISPYGASLMSHTIDKDGYLELPVIGKIQVKDKTLTQVASLIKEALVNVLNQPIVSVKLVNTYISVLGEVRTPGHFIDSEDKLSIFDAIGMAGDITDYGNRKKVILIRNENGNNVRREINLLKSNILASDYYYVRPGDIIYVKPMRSKFWGFREFPIGTILSAITTAILILNSPKIR